MIYIVAHSISLSIFLGEHFYAALKYLSSGERAIVAALYHTVGRGSEVASANWGSAYWNPQLNLFVFDWGDSKR